MHSLVAALLERATIKVGVSMYTTDETASNLLAHNKKIIEEAKSSLNIWGTGEEFRHPVSPETVQGRNELVEHFIHSGAIHRLGEQFALIAA